MSEQNEKIISEPNRQYVKKMIAPIVITVLMVIYILAEIALWLWLSLPWYLGLIGLLFGVAMIGVLIGVFASRIKEIRSGEEDDLSKY